MGRQLEPGHLWTRATAEQGRVAAEKPRELFGRTRSAITMLLTARLGWLGSFSLLLNLDFSNHQSPHQSPRETSCLPLFQKKQLSAHRIKLSVTAKTL